MKEMLRYWPDMLVSLGYRPVATYAQGLPETVEWLEGVLRERDWREAFPLLAASVGTAFADREYSWTLDKDNMQLRSPMPYIYDFEIDGMYKPSGTFKNPADIFIDKQFNIWIADTGNNRILKFDEGGTFIREYGTEENDGKLNAPERERARLRWPVVVGQRLK